MMIMILIVVIMEASKANTPFLFQLRAGVINLISVPTLNRESSQFHRPPDLYFISFISTIEYT